MTEKPTDEISQAIASTKEQCCECKETCSKDQDCENCSALQKKLEEMTSTVKYLQAEFENYRKRIDRDKEAFRHQASRSAVESIIPIVDSFELALNASLKDEHHRGFAMVYAQFTNALKLFGVVPFDSMDKKFDPKFHEAIMQDISDKPSGTIIEEFQKGWMLHDQVLRPAKVKVSK